MEAIVITGVAGLLGSNLAKYIIANHPEYVVIGVDNLFGGLEENIPINSINFKFVKCNVEDDAFIDIFKKYHVKYVFHLAAYAAEGLSPFIRKFNWSNNAISTANVINCCVEYNVSRLIYTSSMSVYGEGIKGERFTEDLIPHPLDPYAISKYACELDIQSAGIHHNLDWCIIRPHNVYGVGQNIFDRYRNVLGIWMYQKMSNEPLTIYGDGQQTRAFSSIDNVIPCLWNAAILKEASREIINVGGTVAYTISDACDCILDVIGRDTQVNYKEARYEVKHAVPSFQKSIDILKYDQNEDLKSGLIKMWDWAKTLKMRERFKWPAYEIDKGLYSYWK
jgi:UDP-glucose 4-epimerase